MGAHSHFDKGGQIARDATSLTLFQECPRKYQYKMLEHWQPQRPSVHLIFGGFYADALQHFYNELAKYNDREQALRSTVHHALIISATVPWEQNHASKTRESLIRTIIWYVDHYADSQIKVIETPDKRVATELSFRIELPALPDGTAPLWCGHLDQVVRASDNQLFVMDQKTTASTLSPYWFKQFDLSGQMTGYTFAGKVIFDQPVSGVAIDAAQVAVGFSRFARLFTHRTDDQLMEWVEETVHTIAQAREAFTKSYFPRNTTSCDRYGGCQFREVCSRAPHIRENFLRADFVNDKAWNPLDSR